MSGLAIFSRALSPGEVQRDFDTWPVRPGTTLGNRASLVALYPFDEGSGREVRDAVSRGNRFAMPDRYVVVAKSFLARPSPDNHLDIVANIIGFIPLGFTLCGYLSSRLGTGASLVTAIILCGLFSLSIESLQWFLPTRDSDMTDVITNTVGAVCGALLYRLRGAWLLGWISKWMR